MIKNKVKSIIDKFKTNDPFLLCDLLNIKINMTDLGNVKGFYQYFKRNKIIHINSLLDYNTQKITCAHELGHAILHPNFNISFLHTKTYFSKSKFESQANKFAVELLLPDEAIKHYKDNNFTINQVALSESIPSELLIYKYNN